MHNQITMNNSTLKNIGAVVAGFIVVVILSIVTDLVLEKTNLMKKPFDLNPLWLIVFVIFYRCLFGVIGSYITARLAPAKPMRLAMIGGMIGFIISIVGVIVMWDTPPRWYGISIVLTALPCAWLGAKIYLSKQNNRSNKTG